MSSAHKPQTIKFSDGSSRQRARQRILRQLTKTKGWERDTSHPRRRVLSALVGFLEYREKMEEAVRRKRDGWNKLTVRQKELMSTVPYGEKLEKTSALIRENDNLVQKIVDHGLSYYDLTFTELLSFRSAHKNDTRSVADHSSVIQSLKHFIRDWSAAGSHERDTTFPQILTTLESLYPDHVGRGQKKVLVPGAGLGRLSYEIAAMGFQTVANEYSFYQNLAQLWILSLPNTTQRESFKLYPFINWWSHQRTTTSLLRGVSFPDTELSALALEKLCLIDGDFTTAFYAEASSYDVVVTLFFIDTARNIVDYLDKIHAALKPGGVWINLGPLLYGTSPWLEPSLDEVLAIAENIGFELVPTEERWGTDSFADVEAWRGKVRGAFAGYGWDQDSLSRNAYSAQFWVAVKK
ncbi:uncharacterized protein H6S33_009498 [Morchella sextelata]|uniref:uncharacterized protein n=1 Tax=Morchella sextelata TaxID=1174677 RepID=UPI001D03729D|nr:uncharacterized protein H6S33_009498 [Morchella sextelata]KAH0613118.1 hypothetical protein H6S33_009498 [Morchella sextelata]